MSRLDAILLPQYSDACTSRTGYTDVLSSKASLPQARTFAQKAMRTSAYASVYQAIRPLGRILAGGFVGQEGREADRETIAELLELRSGATVLDIGCGPGNFTGWFGDTVGEHGLAVGLDASEQMLDRAIRDNGGVSVEYIRGDAESLPFADDVADAVSCLAALYLINDPRAAVNEMLRVLKPGGRLVILTSLGPPVAPLRRLGELVGGATLFGRGEVTGLLGELGATNIDQRIQGVTQTVIASKRR